MSSLDISIEFKAEFQHQTVSIQSDQDRQFGMLFTTTHNTPCKMQVIHVKKGHSKSQPVSIKIDPQTLNGDQFHKMKLCWLKDNSTPIPLCNDILFHSKQVLQAFEHPHTCTVKEGLQLTMQKSQNLMSHITNMFTPSISQSLEFGGEMDSVKRYNELLDETVKISTSVFKTMGMQKMPPEWPIDAQTDKLCWLMGTMSTVQNIAANHDAFRPDHIESAKKLGHRIGQTLVNEYKSSQNLPEQTSFQQLADRLASVQPGSYTSDSKTNFNLVLQPTADGKVSLSVQLVDTPDGERWHFGNKGFFMKSIINLSETKISKDIINLLNTTSKNHFEKNYNDLKVEEKMIVRFHVSKTLDDWAKRKIPTDDCEDEFMHFNFKMSHLQTQLYDYFETAFNSEEISEDLKTKFQNQVNALKIPKPTLCVAFASGASANASQQNSDLDELQNMNLRQKHEAVFTKMQQEGCGHCCGMNVDWNPGSIRVKLDQSNFVDLKIGKVVGMQESTANVATSDSAEMKKTMQVNMNVFCDGSLKKNVQIEASAAKISSLLVSSITQTMPLQFNSTINMCETDPQFVGLAVALSGDGFSGTVVTMHDKVIKQISKKNEISLREFKSICKSYHNEIGYGAFSRAEPNTSIVVISPSTNHSEEFKKLTTNIFFDSLPQVSSFHVPELQSKQALPKTITPNPGTIAVSTRCAPAHVSISDEKYKTSADDMAYDAAWQTMLLQIKTWMSQVDSEQTIADSAQPEYFKFIKAQLNNDDLKALREQMKTDFDYKSFKSSSNDVKGMISLLHQVSQCGDYAKQTQFLLENPPLQKMVRAAAQMGIVCGSDFWVDSNVFMSVPS